MPEYILGKHGQWLGNFASEYVVPADSTKFSLRYPVGWTNCTWYELGGCNLHYQGCYCSDCSGSHPGFLFDQRHPGDTIDPCWTAVSLDDWGVSISPTICQEGCGNCRGPGVCLVPGVGLSSDTVVCGWSCGGATSSPGWPLVMFGGANPSADVRVVSDTSGPILPEDPGLQTEKAMRIDFSGFGAEGATFVGEGGGHDTGRPPYENSGPDYEWTGYRYSTGITLEPGICYQVHCWVKAVPDRYGYTCVGYRFEAFTKAFTIFLNFNDAGSGDGHVTLTGGWQHLTGTLTMPDTFGTLHNAPLFLQTTNSNNVDEPELCVGDNPTFPGRSVTKPRGRVHVKAVHLNRCDRGGPVHVWRWH